MTSLTNNEVTERIERLIDSLAESRKGDLQLQLQAIERLTAQRSSLAEISSLERHRLTHKMADVVAGTWVYRTPHPKCSSADDIDNWPEAAQLMGRHSRLAGLPGFLSFGYSGSDFFGRRPTLPTNLTQLLSVNDLPWVRYCSRSLDMREHLVAFDNRSDVDDRYSVITQVPVVVTMSKSCDDHYHQVVFCGNSQLALGLDHRTSWSEVDGGARVELRNVSVSWRLPSYNRKLVSSVDRGLMEGVHAVHTGLMVADPYDLTIRS